MSSSADINQLFTSTSNLEALGENHKAAAKSVQAQTEITENTLEVMTKAYELAALEKKITNLPASEEPGITGASQNLTEPDPTKLVTQPHLGDSLEERLVSYGHLPPMLGQTDDIAMAGVLSNPGIGSILPWTPHPQHSYKDNSTRIPNRTGRKRPNVASPVGGA